MLYKYILLNKKRDEHLNHKWTTKNVDRPKQYKLYLNLMKIPTNKQNDDIFLLYS